MEPSEELLDRWGVDLDDRPTLELGQQMMVDG
jgi:hypothetical protein